MSNEVLTDEELALVAEQKRRLDLLASMDVHLKEPAEMLALVKRLVAEVDRLRARNEKLETLHAFVRDSDPAYQSLSVSVALSALDEQSYPVQGPMIGWAPKPKESS